MASCSAAELTAYIRLRKRCLLTLAQLTKLAKHESAAIFEEAAPDQFVLFLVALRLSLASFRSTVLVAETGLFRACVPF